MRIELPDLPFAEDALEPHMSKATLQYHHGKHHAGYVNKLNDLIEGTEFEGKSLEEIIRKSAQNKEQISIFNNAAQVWNHNLFWLSLSPEGGGKPSGKLAERLKEDFGSLEAFKKSFTEKAVGQFGSGWAWLVLKDGKLQVISTPNAEPPFISGHVALMTCDVWEHAYYLDYQNARPKFVETFLERLINWEAVARRLNSANTKDARSAA